MNSLKTEALTQRWFDKLGQVYENLNAAGYAIDVQRLQNEPATRDQIKLYHIAIQEFYQLLLDIGSDPDGPNLEDVL